MPRYALFLLTLPLAAQVTVRQQADRVSVEIDGKPFTELFIGPDVRKPYLHPVRSASGKLVTRSWPMATDVPGETKDHPHHRGVWFTHDDVNGSGFWMSDPLARTQDKTKIAVKKITQAKGGKNSGTIAGVFEWIDKKGAPIMTEDRVMVFHDDKENRAIDFDIKFTALTQVKFADTKEGSFGIRLNDALIERKGGKMVNAEGGIGEKNVWGKRSPWVDYYGELEGEKLGVAIFDHPSNPRHPTYWHARAYGLFAANMFGLHDFYNDKTKDGSLTLAKGETLRLRYRILVHPGDVTSGKVADEYKKYAAKK